jgi:hypothetical protein
VQLLGVTIINVSFKAHSFETRLFRDARGGESDRMRSSPGSGTRLSARRKSDQLQCADQSQAFGRRGEKAAAKVKGFGVSLRFTSVAAACCSMRSPGFNAGREPRARRYLFSREWSQNFANRFSEIAITGNEAAVIWSLADPGSHQVISI